MPITTRESTPPPTIGKIGPYTIFVTPPATPSPSPKPSRPPPESPPIKAPSSPVQPLAPPVQAPPQQFGKSAVVASRSDGSALGFFWNAIAKIQNAHSSLDDYVARSFGLNQSKYQWALDDYYKNNGEDMVDAKVKNLSGKVEIA